jgi:hypothetical protein
LQVSHKALQVLELDLLERRIAQEAAQQPEIVLLPFRLGESARQAAAALAIRSLGQNSQTRAVPSPLPLTTKRSSGLKATGLVPNSCVIQGAQFLDMVLLPIAQDLRN